MKIHVRKLNVIFHHLTTIQVFQVLILFFGLYLFCRLSCLEIWPWGGGGGGQLEYGKNILWNILWRCSNCTVLRFKKIAEATNLSVYFFVLLSITVKQVLKEIQPKLYLGYGNYFSLYTKI